MSCTAEKKQTLTITNPLAVERAEVLSIPYTDFKQIYNRSEAFRLIDEKNKEYTYQLEKGEGDSTQNVLVWVELPANGTITLQVQPGKPKPMEARTFARYVPERFDDFAWENDKIAFRMYGKALEGRPDNAEGADIWAKRTDKLVVNEWYKKGDYHKDHGEGMDFYDVGMTLGAGDIAPYADGKIIFSKHYREYDVLENGPLRSMFRLKYEPWEVNGKKVSVTKTISLDAGAQLNRVTAVYTVEGADADRLPVVAGIVLRKGEGGQAMKLTDAKVAAYWEPAHGADGTLGIAVLGESPIDSITENNGHLLAHFTATSGKPVIYYNGGAWDKAGKITNAKQWEEYLRNEQEKQEHPLAISIK
ncbi:DUF4861 domain-containing protein [Olivibacter ginsenosidimutans]|uniref:DUF4861 domain-containing protein n=2 Tax=Olivibacter ginsenosidimutans TaxID=1176537 RepID=A0ABP9C8I6_9SPHI